MSIREQYDELLTERGYAADEEAQYRDMSHNNRAKHAKAYAAATQKYDEIAAAIAAFEAAHPEVLQTISAEAKAESDRFYNAGF